LIFELGAPVMGRVFSATLDENQAEKPSFSLAINLAVCSVIAVADGANQRFPCQGEKLLQSKNLGNVADRPHIAL
jgi:hypothetical protein